MKFFVMLLSGLIGLSSVALAQEISWPQELTGDNGGVVIIYQPQVEVFTGNSLEARAAVSVKSAATGDTPVFGAVWMVAKVDTNRDTRIAVIRDIEINDVRIADASNEQIEALGEFIENSLAGSSLEMSVDQLLSDLDATGSDVGTADLKHTPPEFIHSTEPAMLVSIDGEPVLQEIEGSEYERVVNSAFLIVKDGRAYYLYVGSNTWFSSGEIAGPWLLAARVPDDIKSLVEPAEDDGTDLSEMKIIIATEPSELLVSDGKPSWTPVEGMNLLYMGNTDSNVFLELSTQKYYILLSGRWYSGVAMSGNLVWTHVPNDELPKPFSDIPDDSVNGAVLSQVAGTQQARDAVLENTIPQTAAIDREDSSFSVQYDGDPDFAPIEDIKVEYAQNTASAVFKYGNLYYACDDGVWYVANSSTGPWTVATEVPDAIYNIPASNPHHNVTYVKVYEVTPEVVYVGYTPGYYGSYYYNGAVVYGSGWYYTPWYGPYYYPRYPTWGFHVSYNPWTGWGVGVSWTNGPFRFTFSSHGSWWGVGGYRPYRRAYVHGGYRKTNINIDNSINIGGGGNRPGGGVGNRPETRPNIYDRPKNEARNAARPATAENRQAKPASNVKNDVLTDRSGNVYQRGGDGNWNERDNGKWTQPNNLDRSTSNKADSARTYDQNRRPDTGSTGSQRTTQPSYSGGSAARPQLERDYGARQHGAQRTQNYNKQRSSGGRRRR